MSVILGPLADLEGQLEQAYATNLSPEVKLRKLRALRDDFAALVDRAEQYIADTEQIREVKSLGGLEALLHVRENATIRETLIERGMADPEELDELGFVSHEELDRLAEEGRLDEWAGVMQEAWTNIRFDPDLHPRDRTGKFRNILGKLTPGKTARLPSGVRVRRETGGGYTVHHKSFGTHRVSNAHDAAERAIQKHDNVAGAQAAGRPGKPHVTPRGRRGGTTPKVLHTHPPDHLRAPGTEAPTPPPETPAPPPSDQPAGPGEAEKVSTSDVNVAAKALAEGKYVELQQPREVSTLLDKLHEIVQEAKDRGEDAPNFDLCRVSVKNTNIFCAEHKGIPRVQMPQLKGVPRKGSKADAMPRDARGEVEIVDQFREHLAAKGVKTEIDKVLASNIRASQRELNGAKVAGIYKFLEGGGKIEGPPIFVSREDYVVDGHHRWAAEVGKDFTDNVPDWYMDVERIDLPILDVLREANAFAAEWGIGSESFGQGVVREAIMWKLALDLPYDEDEARVVEAVLRDEGDETEFADERELREAFGRYIEGLHPRDRLGRWAEKFGRIARELGIGNDVRLNDLAEIIPRELPTWTPQPVDHEEGLYAQAEEAQPQLERLLDLGKGLSSRLKARAFLPGEFDAAKEAIPHSLDKAFIIIAAIKGKERAREKVEEKYGGDWSHLTDVLRATVLVPNPLDIPQVLEAIRTEANKAGWEVAGGSNRMVNRPLRENSPGILPSGYGDVQLLLKAPGGIVAEIQVNTTAMWVEKELGDGHKFYERERKIIERAIHAGRRLTERERLQVAELQARSRIIYERAMEHAFRHPPRLSSS